MSIAQPANRPAARTRNATRGTRTLPNQVGAVSRERARPRDNTPRATTRASVGRAAPLGAYRRSCVFPISASPGPSSALSAPLRRRTAGQNTKSRQLSGANRGHLALPASTSDAAVRGRALSRYPSRPAAPPPTRALPDSSCTDLPRGLVRESQGELQNWCSAPSLPARGVKWTPSFRPSARWHKVEPARVRDHQRT
jgi:hypothetical protein